MSDAGGNHRESGLASTGRKEARRAMADVNERASSATVRMARGERPWRQSVIPKVLNWFAMSALVGSFIFGACIVAAMTIAARPSEAMLWIFVGVLAFRQTWLAFVLQGLGASIASAFGLVDLGNNGDKREEGELRRPQREGKGAGSGDLPQEDE